MAEWGRSDLHKRSFGGNLEDSHFKFSASEFCKEKIRRYFVFLFFWTALKRPRLLFQHHAWSQNVRWPFPCWPGKSQVECVHGLLFLQPARDRKIGTTGVQCAKSM